MADAQNIAAQDEGGNPTLGRKVFFLSPSYALTEVIASLRSMEYEVYTIDNYRDAKNILIQNPDSICIVTIDSQMHLPMWAAFVASFNSQKDLGNIILGIFSERYRMESIQSAFDNAQLKAGITLYDDQHKLEDVLKNFVQQLERFGAKGRRAHVRVACALDKTAMMYWIETQNCMHQLKLLDISTVAAAVGIMQNHRILDCRFCPVVGIVFRRHLQDLSGTQFIDAILLGKGIRCFVQGIDDLICLAVLAQFRKIEHCHTYVNIKPSNALVRFHSCCKIIIFQRQFPQCGNVTVNNGVAIEGKHL